MTKTVAVLDAGALVALEKGNGRVRALLARARAHPSSIAIPAGVLAQVWRNPTRRATLAGLTNHAAVTVVPLDESLAKASGVLCGMTGTSDVIDASVVLVARTHDAVVVTSDPDDIRRLDPKVAIEPI